MSYNLQKQLKLGTADVSNVSLSASNATTVTASVDSSKTVLGAIGAYITGSTQVAIQSVFNNGNNLAVCIYNPTSSAKTLTVQIRYLYTE